ncbi:MAG: hypothetical protein ACLQMH_01605 [Solirubrobacteraceae bacterium]
MSPNEKEMIGARSSDRSGHFHQSMGREWAYGMSYRSHRHRNQALPHWLQHYNHGGKAQKVPW